MTDTDPRPLVLLDAEHGTMPGYTAGCRCIGCKRANNARQAAYRATGTTVPDRQTPGRRAGPNRRLIDERPAWMNRADCRGLDPDLFVPVAAKGPGGDTRYDEARVVCNTCPVREECLEYAIAGRETFGMWGGTTPKERRTIIATRTRLANNAATRAARIAAAGVAP